jgi:hypothetical protein
MQPAGVATVLHCSSTAIQVYAKGERSLDGRSAAAAVKELGMTLGGEPEEDRR